MARIIFFGNERLATGVTTTNPTLRKLIEAGHEVLAVVSNYEVGRSRQARQLEIKKLTDIYNIPLLLPAKPTEIIDELKGYQAEVGVLVAYGRIVPQSIIDIFPRGIINIHPSALPLHRGPTPIESVILEGAKKTAVSLMQLTKAMDAGPIYLQQAVALDGTESKQYLADKLLEVGADLVIKHLPAIVSDELHPLPQDDTKATYDQLLSKEAGVIDWQKPAARIEREVRAFTEWPKSRTEIASKDVVLTKAHVHTDTPKLSIEIGQPVYIQGCLVVRCQTGYLCIEQLKPAGKNEMTAAAFIAGYGHLLDKLSET